MTHGNIWSDMFSLGLPVAEKVLRPMMVYLFLIIGLRLAGKRELAQLNPFDLVVLLTLSNTVQNAIIGDDNTVLGGLIGATTLLGINFLTVRFLFEHPKLDVLAEGRSTILLRDGKILRSALAGEMISESELEVAARRQGFGQLSEIQEAVLEPGGVITFSAKKPIPEETRHRELMDRLEELSREVSSLRRAQLPPTP